MKDEKGFTLIEVLVSVFVISMLIGVVGLFQRNVFTLNTFLESSLTAQQEGRDAVKTIITEVRSASQASDGSYPILEADDTSFTFYSDINGDGLKERLRYTLATTTLERGVLYATGTPATYNSANEIVNEFVHEVSNGTTSIFSYYDTSYDGSTAPLTQPVNVLDVRFVEINLIIDGNGARPPEPISFTSGAAMRNLKDNL